MFSARGHASVITGCLISHRHNPITFPICRLTLPEGYQGNRRGFPWAGARGRSPGTFHKDN